MKCRGGAISVAHVGMKTNMRKIKSDTQTAASEAGEAAQTLLAQLRFEILS